MLSIEERPAEVADRIVPGHWEGDLILGKYKRSALGTLVERTTRYTILVPLGNKKDAVAVRQEFAKAFQTVPAELKKSMTYDQGKEMSEHQQFTIDTGIQVYFAHPGSPWERGTNENTVMDHKNWTPIKGRSKINQRSPNGHNTSNIHPGIQSTRRTGTDQWQKDAEPGQSRLQHQR